MKTVNHRIEDLIIKLNHEYFTDTELVNEVEEKCLNKKRLNIPRYLNFLFRILENYDKLDPMWKSIFDHALSIIETSLTCIYEFIEDKIFIESLSHESFINTLVNLFYELCNVIKILTILKIEEVIEN